MMTRFKSPFFIFFMALFASAVSKSPLPRARIHGKSHSSRVNPSIYASPTDTSRLSLRYGEDIYNYRRQPHKPLLDYFEASEPLKVPKEEKEMLKLVEEDERINRKPKKFKKINFVDFDKLKQYGLKRLLNIDEDNREAHYVKLNVENESDENQPFDLKKYVNVNNLLQNRNNENLDALKHHYIKKIDINDLIKNAKLRYNKNKSRNRVINHGESINAGSDTGNRNPNADRKNIHTVLSKIIHPDILERLKQLNDSDIEGATLEDLHKAIVVLRSEQERIIDIQMKKNNEKLMKQLLNLNSFDLDLDLPTKEEYEARPLDLTNMGAVLRNVTQERREREKRNEKISKIFDQRGMFYITKPKHGIDRSFKYLMDKVLKYKYEKKGTPEEVFTDDEIRRINEWAKAFDREEGPELWRKTPEGVGEGGGGSNSSLKDLRGGEDLKIQFEFSELVN